MSNKPLVDEIDKLLPQTQCGLCSYGACRPYAQAIANNNEEINRCPPGGVKTLEALAHLLKKDPTPYLEEMILKTKPPSVAVIRESECIGCTKCIQVCPVDAILGSGKKMHTIIAQECTGCELCIEPCPVDCIDMIVIEPLNEDSQQEKANLARRRYQARQYRLDAVQPQELSPSPPSDVNSRKTLIEEAIARAKAKKGLFNES